MNRRRIAVYAIGGVGILFLVVGVLLVWSGAGGGQAESEIQVLGESSDTNTEVGNVLVDVSGAVKNPGVYHFHYGDRVGDAIEAAGGFSDEVDADWIDRVLNKTEKLKDGIKLYIPKKSDATQVSVGKKASRMVHINSASASELEDLNGVGVSTAEKIISNRPYSRIEELVEKKVLGQKVFDQIKQQIDTL